ncbi:hypothetical protein KP509_21G026000 [Ceratopteris richardii]|nr:hypothetical protein KP509_21G026000 [Ceratopteris richardii]
MDNELSEEKLDDLRKTLDEQVFSSKKRQTNIDSSFVAQIGLHYKKPLMYYQPGGPSRFLKIEVWRSKDVRNVAKVLRLFAQSNQRMQLGMSWQDIICYEEEIKFGMRFFCDTGIAGGAWLEVSLPHIVHYSQQTTHCNEEFIVSWKKIKGLTPDATQFMKFSTLRCSSEPGVEGSSLDTSTIETLQKEHVTEVSNSETSKHSGAEIWLALSPLKIIILHVQCGKVDYAKNFVSSSVVSYGREKKPRLNEKVDQKIQGVISSENDAALEDIENLSRSTAGHSLHPSKDPVLAITVFLISEGSEKCYTFVQTTDALLKSASGTNIQIFQNERAMLQAWQDFIREEVDPDIICVYQLKDSIRYLVERFRVLKLGVLDISRRKGRATDVKSVVSYGKQWVKQQARMTATSNQEVFRAIVEGRIVIDVLRVVLVAYNLSTFTLAECCQVFLGKTKEVLNSIMVAEIWRGKFGGIYRLIEYSLNETKVIWELMQTLQIIPELIEMARVTGLSVSDALYKAQMVRIQSLLLRSGLREHWLLGGPTISGQLSESPFLIHPKESNTAGFYKDPVVILDFASLYPSLYMAYNLCYTTLVHPEDINSFSSDKLIKSPTGACFVAPSIQHGILPRICGSLITARKLAKEKMLDSYISSAERAVLDARQKALKLCSNALYGFTGSSASCQQALPLADSCLSMGAAACKRAVELVSSTFHDAKVLYAQTDSVFIRFCGKNIPEAIELGREVADITSRAFPPPLSLKFEKVLCPFLLLQVNRYAGRDVTCLTDRSEGKIMFVRGLESERRDVPPFVRTVSKMALQEILLNDNVRAALDICKQEIKRLVSGKCSMRELIMTGGLWRVDDHDISRLASSSKSLRKEVGGGATAEEGRGPHVALAVRLKKNDPDRQFHIGERIPYVLVNNLSKLQDDMAEDPLNAIQQNMQLNFHVYLENKLRKPLESILEYVADSRDIYDVFSGSHTLVTHMSTPTGNNAQASILSFYKSKTTCLSCRKPFDKSSNNNVLCNNCKESGASIPALISLLVEKRENETKLFFAHAKCMTCHSGGLFEPVLCTNIDCPAFYFRSEIPKTYEKLSASIETLSIACHRNKGT